MCVLHQLHKPWQACKSNLRAFWFHDLRGSWPGRMLADLQGSGLTSHKTHAFTCEPAPAAQPQRNGLGEEGCLRQVPWAPAAHTTPVRPGPSSPLLPEYLVLWNSCEHIAGCAYILLLSHSMLSLLCQVDISSPTLLLSSGTTISPGFKFHFCHFLSMWHQANYATSQLLPDYSDFDFEAYLQNCITQCSAWSAALLSKHSLSLLRGAQSRKKADSSGFLLLILEKISLRIGQHSQEVTQQHDQPPGSP